MHKILFTILLFISMLNASFFEINLENSYEKSSDTLILEAMSDKSNSLNAYESLSTNNNNLNINLKANFNEMIGLNYKKNLSGIDYDSIGLYIGTTGMRYFSYDKIDSFVDYGARGIATKIDKFTFLNIFTVSKEKLRSSKVETLSASKLAINPDILAPVLIHRNHDVENFVISSENLYDVVKDDLRRGEEYLNPLMFSKKINSNISLYGVTILGVSQRNYTNISNYYMASDGNGTAVATNIAYKIDGSDLPKIDYGGETIPAYFMSGRFTGYEYGLKLTGTYQIKDYFLYLTLYHKNVQMENKYEINTAKLKKHNTLYFQKFDYVEQYIKLGFRYTF